MKRSDFNLGAILIAIAVAAFYGGFVGVGSGAKGHVHTTFAAGQPGDPKSRARVVEITLRDGDEDMTFSPAEIEVMRDEHIRFVIKNGGEFDHDCILDSFENNAKHVAETEKSPEMDHEWEHNYPNAKRVATNKSAKVHWRFTKAGTFEFACLLPGHFDIGMKGLGHVTDERLSATGTSELW
jgi:uncharacterized cupredoxin-like copper-binding protein